MKAKNKTNKKVLYSIIIILILISFLLVYFFQITKSTADLTSSNIYKLETLIRKPDGSIIKVAECSSTSSFLQCSQSFKDCSMNGTYQGNSRTYKNGILLSESGWQDIYTC